jgi:hypothetical protein
VTTVYLYSFLILLIQYHKIFSLSLVVYLAFPFLLSLLSSLRPAHRAALLRSSLSPSERINPYVLLSQADNYCYGRSYLFHPISWRHPFKGRSRRPTTQYPLESISPTTLSPFSLLVSHSHFLKFPILNVPEFVSVSALSPSVLSSRTYRRDAQCRHPCTRSITM